MPIQLLTMPDRRLATLLLPDPERRVRRFLQPVPQPTTEGRWSCVSRQRYGRGQVRMADLLWVEIESADVQNPKVSHNASGLVKAGSSRSMSVNALDGTV